MHPGEGDAPIEDIARWMRDAGRPFLDWLIGDDAEEVIREWIMRGTSELSIRHANLIIRNDRCIAGLSALSGAELARARMADMQALIAREKDRGGTDDLMERLRTSRTWFLAVPADDLYITKVGVLPEHRGRGLAKELVLHTIRRGIETGSRGLRLDVAATNEAAIRLYRSHGFEPIGETWAPELETSYLAMRAVLPE